MKRHFVLCVDDGGYPESLEKRKFYEVLNDPSATSEGMIRVIDESGEDYLYEGKLFLEVSLPPPVELVLETA
ncbi:MAG: hypothetical protein SH807_05605 [Blastochloris sp.]|jgi:hypothetical protein|nr:hypothetical protein [Blastochloris sp.]